MIDDVKLDTWIGRQARLSTSAMERAISATHLVRRRSAFGQVVVPIRGSVLASPAIGDWDPTPDYFFHWLRDSAIVMRAVAELMEDASSQDDRRRWHCYFDDFVRFSLALGDLSGESFLEGNPYQQLVLPDSRRYLRSEDEIRSLKAEKLLADTRFNPDGTIDILHWSRPQLDGPALRALACLHYLACGGPPTDELDRLLHLDLEFTARHADEESIGPWEEEDEHGHHYYVALVQLGALVHGRSWAGNARAEWQAAEDRLRVGLDSHWSQRHRVYKAIRNSEADTAEELVDAAVLLAVLDADLPDGPHSVCDSRVWATMEVIEYLFDREFPINHGRPADRAPALGRSRGDRYFGGGAWYPTTLAAAGICYRLAGCEGQDREALVQRGDAFMRTVRAFTPATGALSEQVDRATGAQTSAPDLTWSHAAFLSTARLRAQVMR